MTERSATEPSGSARGDDGEYRRWDTVTIAGDVLVSTRPLSATRLNDAAVDVVSALGSTDFRSPASVAAETDRDRETVADLFDRLHRRGFLEWRPARDPAHRPPVSVVVTVRNDREHLRRCLDALADLAYPAYEVVVVDDGSTDGTAAVAADHPLADAGRVRVVTVGTADDPLGIGASRNRGVQAAVSDIVAFTDADCRPRPDWLADLVPCLTAADLVGGRVRPAGDATASVYEGINSSLDMGAYASRVDPGGETPYLATANLVGRRAVFESVPFPDRDVAEDVDVCWRALDVGFTAVYTPTGVVEHAYRTGLRAFAARRSTYGESEALLARDGGRRDTGQVTVSTTAVLVVVAVLFAAVAAPPVSTAVVGLAGCLVGLVAVVRGVRLWRRYRRLAPVVSADDVARSWARDRVSSAYVLSRELTRYYAGPVTLVAAVGWAVGLGGLAAVLLVGVVAAVAFPFLVEYRVHDPDTAPLGYGAYYLADHLGYQRGVCRGMVTHRTLAHVAPTARFGLAGPAARVVAPLASAFASGSGSGSDTRRDVRVGGVAASFSVESAAERWLFGEATLRGERAVVADLLDRLHPGDVFFDVGANVGLYSCLAGRVLDEGSVVAFEPHPTNADRLAGNLSANGVDARLVRRALGATDGYGSLDDPDADPGDGTHTVAESARTVDGSSGGRRPTDELPPPSDADTARRGATEGPTASAGAAARVPVVRGDRLVASGFLPQPTVLKVDVEGAELGVLRGLEATVSEPACRLVYCELHPERLDEHGGSPAAVRSLLRACGFSVETIRDLPDGRSLVRARREVDERRPDSG